MGNRGIAGRKIASEEKKRIVERIQDALKNGADLIEASRMMGINHRTYNNWVKSLGIISFSKNRSQLARF